MSVSTTFEKYNRIVMDESGVSEKPEEWEMSDNVMMHLFAQMRHIQARITASTPMSEVAALVGSRSMMLNFQMALGCAVMIEWCYLRSESPMSDSSEKDWYETLGTYWDKKYEVCKKYYNAPTAVLLSHLDQIVPPARDE